MSKPNQLTRAAWNHASAKSCRKGPDSWPRCQTGPLPREAGRRRMLLFAWPSENRITGLKTTGKVNKKARLLATSLLCPFLTFSCFRLTVPLLIPGLSPLSWSRIHPMPQGGLKGPSPEWPLPCFCGPVPTNTRGLANEHIRSQNWIFRGKDNGLLTSRRNDGKNCLVKAEMLIGLPWWSSG